MAVAVPRLSGVLSSNTYIQANLAITKVKIPTGYSRVFTIARELSVGKVEA